MSQWPAASAAHAARARAPGPQVFSGGLDNAVKVWDLRKEALLDAHKGHTDTITGLALSPDGSHLLSNAMDNTLRVWDMRPYAPSANRCARARGWQRARAAGVRIGACSGPSARITCPLPRARARARARRCVKMLVGHIHNFEKGLLKCCWSADGKQVSCGSADRMVNIWEVRGVGCRLRGGALVF